VIVPFAGRLLTEVSPRPLARFVVNFGLGGARAVCRFHLRRKRGEVFPAFLFLSVTDRCNLRCQGCWVTSSGPGRSLDLVTLDRVVSEAATAGVSTFGILGGEPLLHEGLTELFHRHSDRYFLLFTNGTLITDEVAKDLSEAGNVSPLISIEGDAAESDRRRGGDEVLEKSLEGLDRCRSAGLVIGVSTSVCRSNREALVSDAFARDMVRRGAHYLWYSVYRPVGPDPAPELALEENEIDALRRFIVELRSRVPMLVVDAYWDHEGRALCPAASGIGYHIGPGGDLEVCPPIQFACENIHDGSSLTEVIGGSRLLARFREAAEETTPGCLLLEDPERLVKVLQEVGARDTSGRLTGFSELQVMAPRPSHHLPDRAVPETSWWYRVAKRSWLFGLGAYG